VLTIGADLAGVQPLQDIKVLASEAGAVLVCGDDAQVALPVFDPPGTPMTARLDVSSPVAATAQIFWATRHQRYTEEQSVRILLRPGRNVGYCEIPPDARGRLRFDPLTSAGEITMHSLEIRAEE
jgi:hypothetical protein